MRNRGRRHLIAFAAALQLALPGAAAMATTVTPVSLDLQSNGRAVVANISVENNGPKPMPIEIAIKALSPTETGFNPGSGATDDLLVVPPTALIPPGQTQSFRVQWIGDPAPAQSHHYYVSVNELPVKLPEGQSALQILYNFQVLVSVGATGQKADLAVKSAAVASHEGKPAPSITVGNAGGTYGYLSQHRLRIVESDRTGKEVFNRMISGNEFQQLIGYGLVAAGQVRTIVLPIELPSSEGSIVATLLDEHGQ